MPKTKYAEYVKQLKCPAVNQEFRAVISKRIAYMGIKKKDLYPMLNMSKSTFEARQRKPETVTLKELRTMAKELDFSAADLCGIVGIGL